MPWPTTSRHKRGYGTRWVTARAQVLARDHYLCQPCLANNRATPATEVDHKLSKAKGGTDEPENLQAICHPCHQAKTTIENGGRVKPKIGADGWPVQD